MQPSWEKTFSQARIHPEPAHYKIDTATQSLSAGEGSAPLVFSREPTRKFEVFRQMRIIPDKNEFCAC
jgi:hypothetical protein